MDSSGGCPGGEGGFHIHGGGGGWEGGVRGGLTGVDKSGSEGAISDRDWELDEAFGLCDLQHGNEGCLKCASTCV